MSILGIGILWGSAFYHQEKRHRAHEFQKIRINDLLEIRLVPSRGYKKHIGSARLIDHAGLASNLKKILVSEDDLPDVAFVGYPLIEFAHTTDQAKFPLAETNATWLCSDLSI